MNLYRRTQTRHRPLSIAGAIGFLMILIAALAAACSSGPPGDSQTDSGAEPPVNVIFMAGFRAQANLPFVAAYAAKDQGFFSEEGLDVTIRHSSGQNEHLKLLL